jgi:geranylgeranyl pyrophosphate synthase
MNEEWLVCKTTGAYLEGLDEIIVTRVQSGTPGVTSMVQMLIRKGGKRIRPALLLLSGSFGRSLSKDLLFPAAAMEMLHVASLYHDDVMDQATRRRQGPTVNNLYGNASAIHAGSFLFARAMELLADTGANLSQVVSHAVSNLCLGQLRESEYRYDVTASTDHYLAVIRQKTASLFELPCTLGAMLAEAGPDIVQAMAHFGKNLGMAFQLVDDLLDLTGDGTIMGKQPGADLREGVYTHAALLALQQPASREDLVGLLLLDVITDAELDRAIGIIKDSGALGETSMLAEHYVRDAIAAIEPLPQTPAKQSLLNLASYVTERRK